MSNYSVIITLNDATLAALYNGKYYLIAFKGVSGPPGLQSTVWFSQASASLGNSTTISWTELHNAYISNSTVSAGVNVSIMSQKSMNAGQMATLTNFNGLSIGPGKTPGSY